MLTHKMIRKLGKAQSDRSLCRAASYDHSGLLVTDGAWGHSTLILFAPPPQVAREHYDVREDSEAGIAPIIEHTREPGRRACFPVFVGETESGTRIMHFLTQDDETIPADPSFAATALKLAGKNAPHVTWSADWLGATRTILASVLGEPVAIFAEYGTMGGDWTWSLKNDYIPAKEPKKESSPWTGVGQQIAMAF